MKLGDGSVSWFSGMFWSPFAAFCLQPFGPALSFRPGCILLYVERRLLAQALAFIVNGSGWSNHSQPNQLFMTTRCTANYNQLSSQLLHLFTITAGKKP